MKLPDKINSNMFAPCGMNCKVCYRHLKEKKPCHGCMNGNEHKAAHCTDCKIVSCTNEKGITYCYECSDFPCVLINNLEKSYIKRYGVSLIKNSLQVKEEGFDRFMKNELNKWACDSCDGIVSLHDKECSECHSTSVSSTHIH